MTLEEVFEIISGVEKLYVFQKEHPLKFFLLDRGNGKTRITSFYKIVKWKNASAESRKIMKTKKIIDLIKQSKILNIFEGKDCEWLSDGVAGIYPVFNGTEVGADLICDRGVILWQKN